MKGQEAEAVRSTLRRMICAVLAACLFPALLQAQAEETDLKTLAEGVIAKLERMTDKEYDEFSDGLTPEYSFSDDDDSAYGMLSEAFSEDDNDLDNDSE